MATVYIYMGKILRISPCAYVRIYVLQGFNEELTVKNTDYNLCHNFMTAYSQVLFGYFFIYIFSWN